MRLKPLLKALQRAARQEGIFIFYKCETDKPGIERVTVGVNQKQLCILYIRPTEINSENFEKRLNEMSDIISFAYANVFDLSWVDIKFLRKALKEEELKCPYPSPTSHNVLENMGLIKRRIEQDFYSVKLTDIGEDAILGLAKF